MFIEVHKLTLGNRAGEVRRRVYEDEEDIVKHTNCHALRTTLLNSERLITT